MSRLLRLLCRSRLGFVLAWFTAVAAAAAAERQFASGVNLVEVYATVTDPDGNPVTSLTKDDFTVLEDGEPQSVTAFAVGEVPLALAVAVDRSFSMNSRRRLDAAKSAVTAFAGSLRPADRVMLLAIGSEVEEAAPLSSDRAQLFAALSSLDAWGTTALHDAVVAAIDRIQPEKGRRALVVLSDGNDRYSRTTSAETLAAARRADVLVYPIAIGDKRPPLFAELAAVTGGRSLHVKDLKTLTPALASIARELRSQYLLGYTPSRPIETGEDRWRSIEVHVSRPGLRVRARDGYRASAPASGIAGIGVGLRGSGLGARGSGLGARGSGFRVRNGSSCGSRGDPIRLSAGPMTSSLIPTRGRARTF